LSAPSPARRRVVVSHDDPDVAAAVVAAVAVAGADAVVVTAQGVLPSCDPLLPLRPSALVLDVGLTAPYVFEVVEVLASRTARMPVVLLAAVHNPARYRRRPTLSHGVDAVVDVPEVAAALPPVLVRLLASDVTPLATPAQAALFDLLAPRLRGGLGEAILDAADALRAAAAAIPGLDGELAALTARVAALGPPVVADG
jgi:hypothetical protein